MKNQSQEKELQKYISDIKRDLLFYIISDLREKKMTVGQAKYLSKDFLALLPARDKGDVLDKLYILTAVYNEARAVFAKYIGPYEEEKTTMKLALARKYMREKDYENALLAMKGVN